MASTYEMRRAEAMEIQGRGSGIFVPPPLWTDFARLLWPQKTAANLASISGRDERTAKRWLAGEFDPPNCVVVFLINKMFERRH